MLSLSLIDLLILECHTFVLGSKFIVHFRYLKFHFRDHCSLLLSKIHLQGQLLTVVACDWTGLFEVVSSKKAVVVLLIYLQEAMYNKSVDETQQTNKGKPSTTNKYKNTSLLIVDHSLIYNN